MAKPIYQDPLKLFISILVLIGLLYGGLLGHDARYLLAEDGKQQFKIVNDALNRIQIHQLKTEAREILKDLQWRPANQTDKNRLGDIAAELTKLGSTWIMPAMPNLFKGK